MKTTDAWVNRFLDDALPRIVQEFRPQKVILFGSRVSGTPMEGSDLDVVIVAEAFRSIPFLKRMPKVLSRLRWDKHLDVLCYTPEEFTRVQRTSALITTATAEGLLVWEAEGNQKQQSAK